MHRSLAIAATFALALGVLPPAAGADEFRLSWDRCFGDGNVYAKTFACDTNAGSELLVASYVADAGGPAVRSFQAVLDVTDAVGQLPSWWAMNSTGCRSLALGASLAPPVGSSACHPLAAGIVGGIANYLTPYTSPASPNPNSARIVVVAGVPTVTPFPAGQETFLFSVTIPHTRSTGTGACAGCADPACLTLSSLTLTAENPNTVSYLPSSNTQSWAATVTWQSAHRGSTTRSCSPVLHTCYFEAACDLPTPAFKDTWGSIKSIYR